MILMRATESEEYLIADDPVRPELDFDFRVGPNKDFFIYMNEFTGGVASAICVSYNDFVPKTVTELKYYPDNLDPPSVAVFYTVWSYEKGAGREIVFKTAEHIRQEKEYVHRFVTLSPKTRMAERFHLRNGAILLSENEESNNFEYRNV
tara:strand:- start:236 stop:682 length:447 start_codon:yes stop_codon:yes gene_type:complete